MPATNQVVVNQKKFALGLIPARTLLALDARVCLVIAPILDLMSMYKPEGGGIRIQITPEIIKAFKDAIMQILAGDDGAKFTAVVLELCGWATYLQDAGSPVEVRGNEDAIFRDGVWDMYELAFEVGRYNKLSPFVLLADGGPAKGIIG